jgi:hypothetical protein
MTFSCVYCYESRHNLPESAVGDYDPELAVGRPRRVMGSLPTMTGIVGLTAANEALRLLLGGQIMKQKKGEYDDE